jgi:hypothetical protein
LHISATRGPSTKLIFVRGFRALHFVDAQHGFTYFAGNFWMAKAGYLRELPPYAEFLRQQQGQNIEIAAKLTVLELPNLFVLLEQVQRAGDAEATIDLATSLYSLLQFAGKPRLLERVGQVRDDAAAALGDAWNHARFEAERTRIEQQLADGSIKLKIQEGS